MNKACRSRTTNSENISSKFFRMNTVVCSSSCVSGGQNSQVAKVSVVQKCDLAQNFAEDCTSRNLVSHNQLTNVKEWTDHTVSSFTYPCALPPHQLSNQDQSKEWKNFSEKESNVGKKNLSSSTGIHSFCQLRDKTCFRYVQVSAFAHLNTKIKHAV